MIKLTSNWVSYQSVGLALWYKILTPSCYGSQIWQLNQSELNLTKNLWCSLLKYLKRPKKWRPYDSEGWAVYLEHVAVFLLTMSCHPPFVRVWSSRTEKVFLLTLPQCDIHQKHNKWHLIRFSFRHPAASVRKDVHADSAHPIFPFHSLGCWLWSVSWMKSWMSF